MRAFVALSSLVLASSAASAGPSVDGSTFVQSAAYRADDPTLTEAVDVDVVSHHFGDVEIYRVRPSFDGVPFEGADRVFSIDADGVPVRLGAVKPLLRRGSFALAAHEATAIAIHSQPRGLYVDATVERASGLAKRVWLRNGEGFVAAYRVRVPHLNLAAVKDVWIDARTGSVLKTAPAAFFDDAPATARVFASHPPSHPPSDDDRIDAELAGLIPQEVGGHLLGEHFQTRNCCKYVICADEDATIGDENCTISDPTEARCADEDEETEENKSTLLVPIPLDQIPIDLGIDGDTLWAKTVFCAELPHVTSTEEGFVETPVDYVADENAPGAAASEEDLFSEVQAYYVAAGFFDFIRDTMANDEFCLREEAMQCNPDGTPVLDDEGFPVQSMRLTVNALFPEINMTAIGIDLFAGKGDSAGNPVEIKNFSRQDQAVFIPAFSTGPVEVPDELNAFVEIFSRPVDSAVFFQGGADLAYDGTVVAHELTHGIVTTLNPDLGQGTKDAMGARSDPGALNEGWADYFAALFTGSDAIGPYAASRMLEESLQNDAMRNVDNDNLCPNHISGEIHDDSEVWSGVLVDIRKSIEASDGADAVDTFHRLLFTAMAAADVEETFEAQAERLLDLIETEINAEARAAAHTLFESRGLLACERVHNLSVDDGEGGAVAVDKARLFINSPGALGVDRAPSPIQFRVFVPEGSSGFSIEYDQSPGSPFSTENVTLSFLAYPSDSTIEWRYESGQARSYIDDTLINFEPSATANQASMLDPAHPKFGYVIEPGCAQTYIVSVVNAAQESVLIENLHVSFLDEEVDYECVEENDGDSAGDDDGTDGDDDDDEAADGLVGCSSTGGGLHSVIGFAALASGLAWRRRRR